MPEVTPEIFSEEMARIVCGVAIRTNKCAAVLNALADGGMVTVQPSQSPTGTPTLVILSGAEFNDVYEQLTGEPT